MQYGGFRIGGIEEKGIKNFFVIVNVLNVNVGEFFLVSQCFMINNSVIIFRL